MCPIGKAPPGWPPGAPGRQAPGNEKRDQISQSGPSYSGAAGRNRTHDPLVRSQVLYPAELQPPDARIIAARARLAKAHCVLSCLPPAFPHRRGPGAVCGLARFPRNIPRAAGLRALCIALAGRRPRARSLYGEDRRAELLLFRQAADCSGGERAKRKKGPDFSIWPLIFWRGWQESNPRPLGS